MTSKTLHDFPQEEQLAILKDICNKIYIARNISLSHNTIIENLEEIDRLFRDNDNFN
jgi:hypothetical protein